MKKPNYLTPAEQLMALVRELRFTLRALAENVRGHISREDHISRPPLEDFLEEKVDTRAASRQEQLKMVCRYASDLEEELLAMQASAIVQAVTKPPRAPR